MFEVYQTRHFIRQYKKLHDNIIADVNDAINKIAINPTLGEKKKGDLSDIYVYKFNSKNTLYLLGYSVTNHLELISLQAIGTHENFYRDLKRKNNK